MKKKTTLQKIKRKNTPFTLRDFIYDSRSVGLVLISCTALSLIISNLSPYGETYHRFWNLDFFHTPSLHLPHTLLHFINDALMALFFFQVGMEIKREAVIGELSSRNRMILPAVAAVCGVVFPAIIYIIINIGNTTYIKGWAIPTATDIAFSLGILSLLGKSIPHSIKIFLTALAIIDDLCAILIIALFYASGLSFIWLGGVVLSIIIIFIIIRNLKTHIGRVLLIPLGIILWYCMYRSGVHATFAGVIMALMMPIEKIPVNEKRIHFPVNFIILPLFALANTSILITQDSISLLGSSLSWGIIFGLLLGKPLGISLSIFTLVKSGFINLHTDFNWKQIIGVGLLAGIGFTMSIFVSTLAFSDKNIQDSAKLSVLIASFIAMVTGYIWLKLYSSRQKNKIAKDH